jgi:hypothetical protein
MSNNKFNGLTIKFANIFRGSKKTFGQWNPTTGKMHTEKRESEISDFSKHLNGDFGIGIVPIMEDKNVWWGAIDIDNHDGSPISVEVISRIIFSKGLPLVPCRSKSGGVHCYLFAIEPVPAELMRRLLSKWAREIGYEGSEIFPKQVELRDNITGNWINLPYFGAANTNRYAVEIRDDNPVKLTIEEFINYAEACQLTKAMIRSFILSGHEQAPPCIQELIINGVPKGVRNEALYGFTIYLKKKFPPATYKQEIININQYIFEKPVPLSEINKTVQSASRKEYRYKCLEDPFRQYCDSKTCINREFGIEQSEVGITGEGMPEFTKLRVIDTEPPLWELTVNDVSIVIQTQILRNFPLLAEKIMERLLIIVPILKQKDWMVILSGLMQNVEHIEAPDNASIEGVTRERLSEFIDRADFNNSGKDPADKDLILRGLPVIQELQNEPGKRVVMFRGSDFISFLKRTRSEELRGTALWLAIRKMGVIHSRTRIKGKMANVWVVPVDGRGRTKLDFDYDPDKIFAPVTDKTVNILNKMRINF